MARELPKVYEPQQVESKIYDMWQQGGYFHAEKDESKKPFTIVMPPPNVTGQLHMGHAMDATLQDPLIRFKRMQGYNALWIPGVDHAGIATQIKVEEELRKEGLTRYDLGREKFLERVWDWKHKYGNRIVEQQKKLGARPVHHGRGLLQGRAGGLRLPVRKGSDLQGQPHHQLVSPLRHRPVRR